MNTATLTTGRLMGKPEKSEGLPPAAIKRIRDSVARGILSPEYGSQVGILRLAKEITQRQYEACLFYQRVHADYQQAILQPGAVKAQNIGSVRSSPSDPDSAQGSQEAHRHLAAVKAWNRVRLVAMAAGAPSLDRFDHVVLRDAYLGYYGRAAVQSISTLIVKHREGLGRRA